MQVSKGCFIHLDDALCHARRGVLAGATTIVTASCFDSVTCLESAIVPYGALQACGLVESLHGV